ncbi:MAG: FAD-dependent oxidoreductase [Candidatus Moduliflexus flocculans]|nr:FAD-dependent oxidoreductase [Candidatus Moduliflexus flocculans]
MSNVSQLNTDILIAGAGMAGLLAATDLQSSGFHPLVVDKGRGVGGRLASRRIGSATFDHGAQFITARTPRFAALLSEWQGLGLVTEWYRGTNAQHIHWRGMPSMTAIPKHLAKSLNVRLEMKMTALKQEGSHWLAIFENGETIAANAVLLTAPVPQSLALLDAGGVALEASMREQLETVEYEPCMAVMAVLNGQSNIPQPGFMRFDAGPIGWIADNQAKGISAVSAVTIHATPVYSSTHWDDDRREIGRDLLAAAAPWLGSEVAEFQVHAWRYARPSACARPSLSDLESIACIADGGGCLWRSARGRGGAFSGWAAAEVLKELQR